MEHSCDDASKQKNMKLTTTEPQRMLGRKHTLLRNLSSLAIREIHRATERVLPGVTGTVRRCPNLTGTNQPACARGFGV